MAEQKPKNFKLGDKATMFYDPTTKKKIVKGQVIPFLPQHMKSQSFMDRKSGGHIVQTDDYATHDLEGKPLKASKGAKEAKDEKEQTPLEKFSALKKDEMLAQLKEDYTFDDEELAELDKMKKEELIAKYQELEEETE
jgi:hypothetical protein